jgi:hypothetical protein
LGDTVDETERLERNLTRYRYLLSRNTDPAVADVLRELIEEALVRLDALKRDVEGGGQIG